MVKKKTLDKVTYSCYTNCMDYRNLKILILGMLLGATLLAGGMVFHALDSVLRNTAISINIKE